MIFRRRPCQDVQATVTAAAVKKEAEMILDQMSDNLTELRLLILGREEDDEQHPG